MIKENFIELLEKSIKENWNYKAFTDYNGKTFTYAEIAERIEFLHKFFKKCDLKIGDKVALMGKNSSSWGIVYIGVVTYGAVIVPILPDFHSNDVHHIVNHSDSQLLFTNDNIWDELDETEMPDLKAICSLNDFSVKYRKDSKIEKAFLDSKKLYDQIKGHLRADDIKYAKIKNSDLASIVYTSGTTGFSKGVMLPANSLASNVVFAQNTLPLTAKTTIVSFLPLAHSFGCAFEFLYPFSIGSHIVFLGKLPSPKILLKAFNTYPPQLILSVPLILEKIYQKQIKKVLEKNSVKLTTKIPLINKLIYKKIKNKLVDVFGGKFLEIIIGGAALNKEVENFLTQIKFPFTIGYGMTECGPLISYAPWKEHRQGSVGKAVTGMEVIIDSQDPENIVGEILVRGENVMQGYYKNDEATNDVFDEEGWMHTGDLGLIDKDGFIYIKGRSKNMLLGASGQNIYPEEIEALLNNMPFVQESLVISKNNQIVALVYPDYELVDKEDIKQEELEKKMEDLRSELNKKLPAYSKVMKIELFPEEFEKTPTRKIKRFLYNK